MSPKSKHYHCNSDSCNNSGYKPGVSRILLDTDSRMYSLKENSE